MKKIIALLLATVMVLSVIGCGGQSTATQEAASATEAAKEETAQTAKEEAAPAAEEAAPAAETGKAYDGVKLTVWLAPFVRDDTDKSFWDTHIDKFEEETGADVTVEIVGWSDMATKYLTGFMSDNAADIMYMTNGILYDFISRGCLEDLEPYWTDEEKANENFWDSTYYGGDKHYMIPFAGGTGHRGYIFNMEILEAAGVDKIPTNWDELLDMCEKVKTSNPDVYPFLNPLTGNANAYITNFLEFYYQSGGNLLNADGTAYTIDTPEALEAMNFIKELVDKGYFSTDALGLDDSAVRDLFAEGKIACTVLDQPQTYLTEADFEWVFSTEMQNTNPASMCPVDTISVNSACENKQAAVDLLKFMRSEEVMTDFFDQIYKGGQILKTYPVSCDDPRLTDAFSHPERTFTEPVAPGLSLVADSCLTNTQLVVMGTLTPEDALKQIQAEADKAFQ